MEFLAVVVTALKSFGTRRASFASVSVVALAITEATTPFLAMLEVRLDTCLHAAAEPSFLRAILISIALCCFFATVGVFSHTNACQVRVEFLAVVDTTL